jgi:heme/copper-type cytochrome/quinol oxidase subunit 4
MTAFVLMTLTGVGMIVCGVFTLESMMLHLLGFLLAVPLPAVGFILAGAALRRTDRRLAVVGIAGGAVTLGLFAVFMAIFDASGAGGNEGVAGLVQRLLILVALATQSALVVGISRHRPGR